VKIADLAGIDLRWLLTGESATAPVPVDHPVLQRAAQMLRDCPEAAQPLAAFLDLLAESLKFPHPSSKPADLPQTPESSPADAPDLRIPVLGRSAAGVPQFWSPGDQTSGLKTLAELLARMSKQAPRRRMPALLTSDDAQGAVGVVTLDQPDSQDVVEYIAAHGVKARYRDAFAVRIDGDSMSPEIRHGDLVILSPAEPAADGRPAVIQLKQQIGVTCKLFRREGGLVHLVPINEQFSPTVVPVDQVVWTMRVLARVRPGAAGH